MAWDFQIGQCICPAEEINQGLKFKGIFKIFIYLVMLGLSCSMQGLCCVMRELLMELSVSSGDVWAQ